MNDKILFVDDEANILTALRRQLHGQFAVDTALGGEQGLAKLRANGPFAVVVSDLRMPGMDGVQFLGAVHDRAPDTVRVMLTGNADMEAAVAAVNEGNIFRFLMKPVQPHILTKALQASLQQYRLVTAERDLLQKTLSESVRVLTEVLSLASPVACSRASRITHYVRQIAGQMMLPNAWQFELAAQLSQIGCVALPSDVLEKVYAGFELDDAERAIFAQYPTIGHDLLVNIPRLDSIAKMISRQLGSTGEGSGRRDLVSLGSQMLQAAIDYDALITHGKTPAEAAEEMRQADGKYDPIILSTLGDSEAGPVDVDEKTIRVEELRAGMFIGQTVRARSGRLLLTEGQEVTQSILDYLRCWNERGDVIEPIRVLVPRNQLGHVA